MAFWINIYVCQPYPRHGPLSVNQLKNDSYRYNALGTVFQGVLLIMAIFKLLLSTLVFIFSILSFLIQSYSVCIIKADLTQIEESQVYKHASRVLVSMGALAPVILRKNVILHTVGKNYQGYGKFYQHSASAILKSSKCFSKGPPQGYTTQVQGKLPYL